MFGPCQNWERCESGLEDSMLQLKDMKTRLNRSMPESDDELQSAGFSKVCPLTELHDSEHHISSEQVSFSDISFPSVRLFLLPVFCHPHFSESFLRQWFCS